MNNFLNLDSDQGILDKRPSPGIIDIDGGRDSSCEVVEDKNSKMQKLMEKAGLEDDKEQNRLWANTKSRDHSQSFHHMNQKEQQILSGKPSIQKEEKALAQVSGDNNQLKQINENILDEGEKKAEVAEVEPDDLD